MSEPAEANLDYILSILAQALWDSEHTTRINESPDEIPDYWDRARRLLYAFQYRSQLERMDLARHLWVLSTTPKAEAPEEALHSGKSLGSTPEPKQLP
jgi:hypothetical protein